MNKISVFYKMNSEVSFSSSLSVEEALNTVRENTNLTPDVPVDSAERDKYMFIAHDKIHPSLNRIIPNMHFYGQMHSILTPVFDIEFSSQGKVDQTEVMIKAAPEPNSLSIWKTLDVICILLGLAFLMFAVFTKEFRYLFGTAFAIAWIPLTNWIGFWMPYKSALNDLKTLLKDTVKE